MSRGALEALGAWPCQKYNPPHDCGVITGDAPLPCGPCTARAALAVDVHDEHDHRLFGACEICASPPRLDMELDRLAKSGSPTYVEGAALTIRDWLRDTHDLAAALAPEPDR